MTGKVGRARVACGSDSWNIWKAHFGLPGDADELKLERIRVRSELGKQHICLSGGTGRHMKKRIFDAYTAGYTLPVGDVVRRMALVVTNALGQQRIRVFEDKGVIWDEVVEDTSFGRPPRYEHDAMQNYRIEAYELLVREQQDMYMFSIKNGHKTYKICNNLTFSANTNVDITEVYLVPTRRMALTDTEKAIFELPKAMGSLYIQDLRGLALAYLNN